MIKKSLSVWHTPVNGFWIFSIICIISITIGLTGNHLLLSDDLFFASFGEQLTYDRIVEIIEDGKRWAVLGYIILPAYLFLKFFLVAICLEIGVLFSKVSASFKDMLLVVMQAEVIFFMPSIVKFIWFGLFFRDYTLQDLQFFYPLSLINLTGDQDIQPWLAYPLQLLNIFEVGYWLLLALYLMPYLNRNFASSLNFVARTYGVGLLLWVIFVMFLTVSLT